MKLTILLLSIGALSLNTAFAQQSNGQAPLAKGNEATLSFGDIPELKDVYITASPTKRNDGIPVGVLGDDGGNKPMILQLAQEIANGKLGNFDSYLIAHKGKLIFESYYRKGRINLPHPQASATKSYTSLALGRAIQLGYLTIADLHKPITNFLKDLNPTKFVNGVEHITLHKALTMRSGIQLSSEQREELDKDPSLLKGQGQIQAFFEHSKPITEASQVFAYKDDPRLVMQVIEAVVPGSAKDFIKKELLDKMGITNYNCESDINGLPNSGNGTRMTPRDMIKWGTLAMNKGKWNGEQLVPAEFITQATSKIVDQSEEYDAPSRGVSGTAYGYFFWQADFSKGDKSFLAKSARGGSGQNIYVIEELDLIVVTTTHRPVDSSVSVTAERVIPAFIEKQRELIKH
ncbi:MAG: serine hydrolase [Cyclobacteriaceae bacterium]